MCNDSDPVMAFPVVLVVCCSLSQFVGWKCNFESIHGQAQTLSREWGLCLLWEIIPGGRDRQVKVDWAIEMTFSAVFFLIPSVCVWAAGRIECKCTLKMSDEYVLVALSCSLGVLAWETWANERKLESQWGGTLGIFMESFTALPRLPNRCWAALRFTPTLDREG